MVFLKYEISFQLGLSNLFLSSGLNSISLKLNFCLRYLQLKGVISNPYKYIKVVS